MNTNPYKYHLTAAKHVAKYLSNALDQGFNFVKCKRQLFAYCDADCSNDSETRRSFTGYVFYLAGSSITWESKLQPTVALRGGVHAAICATGNEASYLKTLFTELGLSEFISKTLQS